MLSDEFGIANCRIFLIKDFSSIARQSEKEKKEKRY